MVASWLRRSVAPIQNPQSKIQNRDGDVDFDDINPLIAALGADPLTWNVAHPGCHWLNGDCDADGDVDFDDINAFVALLSQ